MFNSSIYNIYSNFSLLNHSASDVLNDINSGTQTEPVCHHS